MVKLPPTINLRDMMPDDDEEDYQYNDSPGRDYHTPGSTKIVVELIRTDLQDLCFLEEFSHITELCINYMLGACGRPRLASLNGIQYLHRLKALHLYVDVPDLNGLEYCADLEELTLMCVGTSKTSIDLSLLANVRLRRLYIYCTMTTNLSSLDLSSLECLRIETNNIELLADISGPLNPSITITLTGCLILGDTGSKVLAYVSSLRCCPPMHKPHFPNIGTENILVFKPI